METNAGTYTSKVTYMDLVKEVADLSPEMLGLLIEFARMLRTHRWVITPLQAEPESITSISPIQVISHPASELLKWAGSIDLGGGNALEDTESLYD